MWYVYSPRTILDQIYLSSAHALCTSMQFVASIAHLVLRASWKQVALVGAVCGWTQVESAESFWRAALLVSS